MEGKFFYLPSKKTDSHFRKIWSFFSVKKFRRRDGSQFEIWLLSLCLKCRFTYDRRYIISIWKVVVKINFSIAILSINTVLIAFADGVKLILNCNYTLYRYLSSKNEWRYILRGIIRALLIYIFLEQKKNSNRYKYISI